MLISFELGMVDLQYKTDDGEAICTVYTIREGLAALYGKRSGAPGTACPLLRSESLRGRLGHHPPRRSDARCRSDDQQYRCGAEIGLDICPANLIEKAL